MAFPHKLTFPALPPALRKAASFAVITFLIFLLFPPYFSQPVREGLDPSYDIAIHLDWKYHVSFGKDLISTFGPLAILNSRFPVAVYQWVYLLLDIYFLVTLSHILTVIFKKHFGVFAVVFLVLAFAFEIDDSPFQRYFLFFLFYLFSFVKEPRQRIYLIQAVLLSLLSFYYNVNLGMTALLLFFIGIGYLLVLKKISIKGYALILFAWCSCILLSAWLLNVSLKGYIAGSLHLIFGYNDAMFLPGDPQYAILLPTAVFVVLLMTALCVAFLAASLFKKLLLKYSDELFIYSVVLLVSFVLFKSGFVRFDAFHPFVFFRIISLVAGLLYLFSPIPVRRIVAICAWAVLIRSMVSIQMLSGEPNPGPLELISTRTGEIGRYFSQVKEYKKDPEETASADSELKRVIGDHSVDIIPVGISSLYFNGLRYDPRPVIPSYSAYDSYLDNLNYRKYMSADGPDYILFSLQSIDDRYPFFDESKTKLAIFSQYTIAGEIKGNLLLKKKALSSLVHTIPPGLLLRSGATISDVKMGEEIPVSDRPGLQYSKIFVRYTLLSRISRFFYHPPALKITLTLVNDKKLTYRAIPPMLEDGVILNKYIGSLRDFQMLMQSGGRLGSPVKKFRIEGEGFAGAIKIVTTYYTFPPKPATERSVDSLGLAKLFHQFDQYKPFVTDSSAYLPDSFRCWVDKEEDYSPLIQIEGWAFREKGHDKNVLVKAVLRSGNTFYELPSERQDRWDISTYYKRKDTVVGFIARVGKSQLPPGKYQVGIVMTDTLLHQQLIRYTDRSVINE
jgi:hypothetical protein